MCQRRFWGLIGYFMQSTQNLSQKVKVFYDRIKGMKIIRYRKKKITRERKDKSALDALIPPYHSTTPGISKI